MIPKPEGKGKNYHKNKWLRFRKNFLKGKGDYAGRYRCNHCGNLTEAPEVDHIIKRSVAPKKVYQADNLQILCHECHLRKDFGMVFH